MKVGELVAKLMDEDQEANAVVVTRFRAMSTARIRLDVLAVDGKSGDYGGVVIRAELDDD